MITRIRTVARDGAIAALQASRPANRRCQKPIRPRSASCEPRSPGWSERSSSRPSSWVCSGENQVGDDRSGPRPNLTDRESRVARHHRRSGRWWFLTVGPLPACARRWGWIVSGLGGVTPAAKPVSVSTTPRRGGNPIHGLLGWEQAEVLAIFNEWADTDRSHRKLAHRGSYEGRVWVSPATVDRVLARNNLRLAGETRPPKSHKTPWPAWTHWRPNQPWCWDGSQFEACEASKYAYGIIDLVSRHPMSRRAARSRCGSRRLVPSRSGTRFVRSRSTHFQPHLPRSTRFGPVPSPPKGALCWEPSTATSDRSSPMIRS